MAFFEKQKPVVAPQAQKEVQMSTTPPVVVTAPPVVTPAAPKVSWLKKVGQFLGKVVGLIAKDGKPVVDDAATVAKILLPQFAGEINAADNIADNIMQEIVTAEAAEQAGVGVSGGAAKLAAVAAASGPALDNWINSKFPGAATLSADVKNGLINAFVAVFNDLKVPPTVTTPPPSA
jgi:hypothetical protein